MVSIVGLIAIGQRIQMGIVEQALGSVSPRETLIALVHIIVFDEFGTGQIVRLLVAEIGVDQAQTDSGHRDEEGQTLPDLVATSWEQGNGMSFSFENVSKGLTSLIYFLDSTIALRIAQTIPLRSYGSATSSSTKINIKLHNILTSKTKHTKFPRLFVVYLRAIRRRPQFRRCALPVRP